MRNRDTPEAVIAALKAKGMDFTVGPACGSIMPQPDFANAEPERKARPAEMHMPLCSWHGDKLLIVVGIQTANETNQREWKAKNRRAGEAWKRTRDAVRISKLCPIETAFQAGKPVRVEFCRLAPRQVDKGSVGACVKGVEDALAYLCGIDDGSPLWQSTYTQERSPYYGVRVLMEIER